MTTPVDMLVLAGGDRRLGALALAGTSAPVVIAADAGTALADDLGLTVDVAVGDFDSLDAARLAVLDAAAGRGEVDVRRHPVDKDAADLALALDVAVELAAAHGPRVVVAGIEAGRSDFALANQLLVASPRYAALDRCMALADARVWVVDDRLRVVTRPGAPLSVVPVHGPAVVSFTGVRWPLRVATLEPGTTWAMSNEAVAGEVALTVHAGTVLLFDRSLRPGSGPAR